MTASKNEWAKQHGNMDLNQLRCFVAAAEELHFGRAAQGIGMMPAALGRHIRLLEQDLGVRLMIRTTRQVSLTNDGALLLEEGRKLIAQTDALAMLLRSRTRENAKNLRVGAIDSAAAGLLPLLLQEFRLLHPQANVQIIEDKTFRLLPRLLSGNLDLVIVRPPDRRDSNIEFRHLLFETAVVALPTHHPLAHRGTLAIQDLAGQPMIVPERRSRPYSHDLTIKLFAEAGLLATIGQIADEKQTIIHLVATGFGAAIVPRWTSRLALPGVVYLPLSSLSHAGANRLPLSVAFLRNSRALLRDALVDQLIAGKERYAQLA